MKRRWRSLLFVLIVVVLLAWAFWSLVGCMNTFVMVGQGEPQQTVEAHDEGPAGPGSVRVSPKKTTTPPQHTEMTYPMDPGP